MKYYIGIDLGGTNIVAGVVDEQFQLIAKASEKTLVGRPAIEIAKSMAKAARTAAQNAGVPMEQIEMVGIGSPGIVDNQKKEVIYASNLYFQNVPIGKMVEDELHKPVFIANDADAAAYGEFMAGAGRMKDGKHISNMLAITLGTGVGSGIIINSKIYNGYGFAGLILTTKEQMNKNPDSLMWKLCDGDIDKVDGRTCFDAAAQGDKAGQAAVEEYTGVLSEVIVNAVNTLQPEIICLGGGVSKQGENLLRPIREHMNRFCFDRFSQNRTEVRIAELGNDAGVIGAALIGLQA